MKRSRSATVFAEIVRNSYTCARDSTVSGIFCSSVVAIMKTTCGGGSSIDLSSALNDERREHVHLVDDEHLVAVADRRDRQAFDDHLAHVVDAGVRGRVDLEHVDVAPLGDLDAGFADAAWLRRRPVDAVERPRKDARRRRLAAAARAGKHERLRQTAGS